MAWWRPQNYSAQSNFSFYIKLNFIGKSASSAHLAHWDRFPQFDSGGRSLCFTSWQGFVTLGMGGRGGGGLCLISARVPLVNLIGFSSCTCSCGCWCQNIMSRHCSNSWSKLHIDPVSIRDYWNSLCTAILARYVGRLNFGAAPQYFYYIILLLFMLLMGGLCA